jgi:hypothetical protein
MELIGGDMPLGQIRGVLGGGELSADEALAAFKATTRHAEELIRQHMDTGQAIEIAAGLEAEGNVARKLGVTARVIAKIAYRRWGRSLTEERDRRIAAAAEAGGDRRALRGHETRKLTAEIEAELVKED